MSPTTQSSGAQSPAHARLGALVREKRERLGLSMDQLAAHAGVSRSSIHRLEHGSPTRPTPSKLARILAVVGIDAEGARASLPDDQYLDDLLVWMSRSDAPSIADQLDTARTAAATPDLVAIHQEGSIARVQVTGNHLDELSAALRRAGWLVTRPD